MPGSRGSMLLRLQTITLNLIFYFLFFIVVVLLVPVLVIIGLLRAPFLSQRENKKSIRMLIRIYGRSMLFLGWPFIRVRVEKEAGNPPKACIYVSNHRATSDGFLMGMLHCEGVQVVNIWPFRVPLLGFFARMAGYLSIREMPIDEFMRRSSGLLSQGVSVISFPEGTRAGSRRMGPFHSALFRLALQTGAPIVPICLSGTEDKPRKGSAVMHPGLIRMRLLAPITQEAYRGMSPFQLKNMVRDRIASELDRMELAE
ncbi:MAG: lysophospholipid acyltransferase family protein [Verrucomicrobiota bacterium]